MGKAEGDRIGTYFFIMQRKSGGFDYFWGSVAAILFLKNL